MPYETYFCILLALTACVSLSAQQRGDKAISAFAGATFSNAPYTMVLAAVGFDYFVADNFRLSLGVGVPFTSTIIGIVSVIFLAYAISAR